LDRGVASVLPLPVASTWSRVWLGWWCIVPLLLSVIWLFINPLFFAPPRSTSTGRPSPFSESGSGSIAHVLPPGRFPVPCASACAVVPGLGLVPLVYGFIAFDAVATLTGVSTVEGGKLWYLDRMARLFDEVELRRPEVARWEY
jgi:hypothetical protein